MMSFVETTDESIQIDVAQGSNKVTTNSTEGATKRNTKAVTTQQPVKTTKPATTTKLQQESLFRQLRLQLLQSLLLNNLHTMVHSHQKF